MRWMYGCDGLDEMDLSGTPHPRTWIWRYGVDEAGVKSSQPPRMMGHIDGESTYGHGES